MLEKYRQMQCEAMTGKRNMGKICKSLQQMDNGGKSRAENIAQRVVTSQTQNNHLQQMINEGVVTRSYW